MKTLDWIRTFEQQQRLHGKVLFRVTELANLAGSNPHALNVELSRLVDKGIVTRYATGVYGLPGAATVDQLAATLDAEAYITGLSVLFARNLVTQAPSETVCFTNRRHNRSARRRTAFGLMRFVCVRPLIHARPPANRTVPLEQAFCDFVYLTRRQGVKPMDLVTLHRPQALDAQRLARIAARYPATVMQTVREWISGIAVHERQVTGLERA